MSQPNLPVICIDDDDDILEEPQQQRSSDDDVVEVVPDSNCVICLEKTPTDPTLLSCCSHYFCYTCISTWIFNNPSCPMCKKPLEFIKHKLRPVPKKLPARFEDYQGEVENVPDKIANFELELIRSVPDNYDFHLEVKYVTENLTHLYTKLDRITHLLEVQDYFKKEAMKSRKEIADLINRYSKLKIMLTKTPPPSRSDIYNNPEFRRIVYRYNLGPRNRVAPKFPFDSSASNVEQHEKVVRSRLIAYLSMELSGILTKNVIDFDRYLEVIMGYYLEKNKHHKSKYIRTLSTLGIANPHHFLSNLTHYLNSGQRLNIYHENTEWRPRGEIGFRHLFTDSSDVQVISEMAPQQAPSGANDTRRFSRYRPLSREDNSEIFAALRESLLASRPLIMPDDQLMRPANDEQVIHLSDDEDSSRDGDAEDNSQIFAHPACRFNQPLANASRSSILRPLELRRSRVLRDMPSNLIARELLRDRGELTFPTSRNPPYPGPQIRVFPDVFPLSSQATSSYDSQGSSSGPIPVIDVDESDEQPGPSTSDPSEPGPSSSSSSNSRHPRIRFPDSESDSDVQYLGAKRPRL